MDQVDFFSFYDREVPKLLAAGLSKIKDKRNLLVLDLGCGEGALLSKLQELGFLENAKIIGVDNSKRLLQIAKEKVKNLRVVTRDVTNTNLKGSSTDFVLSNMVIEHLVNPGDLVLEIKRILKPRGFTFVSTIVKKNWATYFYRNRGRFVIDPTHSHEFSSLDELVRLFEKNGFKVIGREESLRNYSLLEIIIKVLLRAKIIRPTKKLRNIFSDNLTLSALRKIVTIPVIGFYEVSVLCEKN